MKRKLIIVRRGDVFQSKAQQGYLFAKKPEVAKEFAAKTPKAVFSRLPEHVSKKQDMSDQKFRDILNIIADIQQMIFTDAEETADSIKVSNVLKNVEKEIKQIQPLVLKMQKAK